MTPKEKAEELMSKFTFYKIPEDKNNLPLAKQCALICLEEIIWCVRYGYNYEYIKRYIDRGNTESFIDLIYSNWNNWIEELINQDNCDHLVLNKGQYLSNTLKI